MRFGERFAMVDEADMALILSDVDWSNLTRRVSVETKNREVYQPLISVYRWWARRPHSLMGALLEAASCQIGDDAFIADPFSGGGTVAIEAARRGYRIYAQDINPWAAWGLKVSLTPVDPEELRWAGKAFLAQLRSEHQALYETPHPKHGLGTVAHTFRVRTGSCDHCRATVWFYPYAMLTLASRSSGEPYSFYGCRRCGTVSRHARRSKRQHCSRCGYLTHRGDDEAASYSRGVCPHCRHPGGMTARRAKRWELVLVQRVHQIDGRQKVVLDWPAAEDRAAAEVKLALPDALAKPIPDGVETARLVRAGFETWGDLYPTRQLHVLLSAARVLADCQFTDVIRDRLALCIIGAAEMPGHLCRWDRFHPKVFEALSNHRYSFDGLAVEPNPLSPVGRGSLQRRIDSSVRAAVWLRENVSADNIVTYGVAGAEVPRAQTVAVVQGSSERQFLASKQVSLVLTDPPYFDSVQYGELAGLFLTWMKAVGIEAHSGKFDASREAVPNRTRKTDASNYCSILKSIFRECGRTLKPNGRLILTYHSTDLRGWAALGAALATTGFRIVGLSVAGSENATDHSKRGKRSFVTDLLIECVKTNDPVLVKIVRRPRTPEERELLHVGRSIAEAGTSGYAKVRELFVARSRSMRDRRINAPEAAEL